MRLLLALTMLWSTSAGATLIFGDYEWSVRTGGTYAQSLDQSYHDLLGEGWTWATGNVVTESGLYETRLTHMQEDQLLGDFADDCPTRSWGERFCWLRLARTGPINPLDLENGWSLALGLNHPDFYFPTIAGSPSFLTDWVNNSYSYNRLAYRPAAAVPLPAAAWLFITGLAGFGFFRKRQNG